MNQFVNSLANISSGFTVFEKDQVLTESHLNSITAYLDPQDRLTRVNLFGVGIVQGFEVGSTSSRVILSSGLGITTDGDLLCEAQAVQYSAFREYGLEAPKYDPLYKSANIMFPAWELVRVGQTDASSKPLSQFANLTNLDFRKLACVLLVESYVHDEDICQVDDCDNLGKDRLCTIKLLMLEVSSLNKLKHAFRSPKTAHASLNPIFSQRAILTPAVSVSMTKYNAAYQSASKQMHSELLKMQSLLKKHYPNVVERLSLSDWEAALKSHAQAFKTSKLGVQYYYDFLNDLTLVWNELCRKAPLSLPQLCPDVGAFPKHLILGRLNNDNNTDPDRFEFYPSVDASNNDYQEFIFLIEKLDAMISSFDDRLVANKGIQVTPSLASPVSLGDAAVPFYYQISDAKPLQHHWNFALSQRGKGRFNFGYRSQEFDRNSIAPSPLTGRIDQFPFFRVEGHLGQKVETVQAQIESLIAKQGLPFSVRSAYIGSDKRKIVKKKGIRYNDLHRFHRLIRQDISHQLDEVKTFNNTHKANIKLALSNNVISDDSATNNGASVTNLSNGHNKQIDKQAKLAQGQLKLNYVSFTQQSSWQANVADTMETAGRYKQDFGKVTKTDFNTPFDGLIDNTRVNWLPWLDLMIKEKDDKEDDKLMISKLLGEHPGLDHSAGVTPGGTFVLIYNDQQQVVGDCASACHIPEPDVVEQPDEPEFPKPVIRPPFIIDKGILLDVSRDSFFDKKFAVEDVRIDQKFNAKLNVQEKLVTTFKDSFSIYSNSLTKGLGKTGPILGGSGLPGKNVITRRNSFDLITNERERLDAQISTPGLSTAKKRAIAAEIKDNEGLMVREISRTATLLSDEKIDVAPGTDGALVIEDIGVTLAHLDKSPQSKKKALAAIKKIQSTTSNKRLKIGLSRFITP